MVLVRPAFSPKLTNFMTSPHERFAGAYCFPVVFFSVAERLCTTIPNRPNELKQLDGDTAVSHNSFEAAMRAAGAVCDAIDR